MHTSLYFKATAAVVFGLLCIAVCLCLISLFTVSAKDEKAYRKLVESANPINSNIKAVPYTAQQQRKGVQKDILFSQGADRLQIQLSSSDSVLVLDRQENKMEIVEKMQNVRCVMQEELYYSPPDLKPMQHLRCIEADHATYHYKNDHIMAEDVTISRYSVPGHTLVTSFDGLKPEMRGKAKNVEYALKGKVSLTGDVVLEHDLGSISAQTVVLDTPPGEKKIRLGILDLSKDVRLNLKNGGTLDCAHAKLDFKTMQGSFYGDAEHEYVMYKENRRDRTPIILTSKKMAVQFAKTGKESHPAKEHITQLLAENSVMIDYNGDIVSESDIATYENELGLLSLRASGPAGICKVSNSRGDVVHASTICYKMSDKQLHVAFPKGVVNSRIEFSSDTMMWDLPKHLIVLRDHVVLNHDLGKLTNDREIKISQTAQQWNTIESDGKTVVVIEEKEKKATHQLTCFGKAIVNHAKLEIRMESPRDKDGKVIEGQQVFFEDPYGVIYADKITLRYGDENHKIIPKVLILEENVKMMNTYATVEPASPLVQYALADRVEYSPQSKEAVFSSFGNRRRVLFYDKTHDLQVSAPTLNIKRDKATHKDVIKGIGDVRFSFIEKEFEHLRSRFSLSNLKEKGIDGNK